MVLKRFVASSSSGGSTVSSSDSVSDTEAGSENSDEETEAKSRRIADDTVGFPPRFVDVTECQRRVLHGWGRNMLRAAASVSHGVDAWLASLPHCTPMWYDFARLESPAWALQELNIRYREIQCCEKASGPQKFIFRNTQPDTFFPDIFTRRHACPSPEPPCATGAPCDVMISDDLCVAVALHCGQFRMQ